MPAPVDTHYAPGGAKIFQRMSALAAQYSSVNLGQGIPEPLYDTLWTDALRQHAGQHTYQYVPSIGSERLRTSVAALYGVDVNNVVLTSGCTESLAASLQTLATKGRTHVVWSEPFYSFYPGMAHYAGLTARTVALHDDGEKYSFDIDGYRVAAEAAGPGRAVLLVNTPHNPTGAVMTDAAWDELLDVAESTDAIILVDDAYRDFLFDASPTPYTKLVDSGRVLVAGSASKSLAAAGNRVGWMLVPERLGEMGDDAHMHMSFCVPAFMQEACADVLEHVQPDLLAKTSAAYDARRTRLMAGLKAAGADVRVPGGGFFVVATFPESATFASGEEFAHHLTSVHGITPIPMDLFYTTPPAGPFAMRFSFCLSDAALDRGLEALSNYPQSA